MLFKVSSAASTKFIAQSNKVGVSVTRRISLLKYLLTSVRQILTSVTSSRWGHSSLNRVWRQWRKSLMTVTDVTVFVAGIYYFTGSKPVFQPKCKSNIFWVLVFESILTNCWIKKISVSHFSPPSRPLRTPASHPFLSRLPYPFRPLCSRAPAPLCPPPTPRHCQSYKFYFFWLGALVKCSFFYQNCSPISKKLPADCFS